MNEIWRPGPSGRRRCRMGAGTQAAARAAGKRRAKTAPEPRPWPPAVV